jgi:hypothetical protein
MVSARIRPPNRLTGWQQLGRLADIGKGRHNKAVSVMPSTFSGDVVPRTSELIALLTPNHLWHADVVRRLQQTVQRDDLAEAELQFSSVDMWGGSGSVTDVSFADGAKDQRICELMIELVDAFAKAGIANKRASEMAAIYRSWLENDVFGQSAT